MASFNQYMSLLKKKIDFDYKDNVKNNITSFLRHFDDNGFIIIRKVIKDEFFNIVIQLLEKKNIKQNCIDLLQSNDIKEMFSIGERVFIQDFYQKMAFRPSNLILKNILYEDISVTLYQIYFFSISLLSFEEYFFFNNQLEYDNSDGLKLISNYILNNYNIYDDNGMTSTSFKLMSLGHLLKKDFDVYKEFIIENPEFAYARIALELNKGLENSNIIPTFLDFKEMYYAPSTPMFFHSLTKRNLLSSCFLLNVEDTTNSIGNLFNKVSNIQKYNSGIGVSFNKIRSTGRPVMDGITISNGIEPFITILATLSEHFKNNKRQRSANINISLSIDHPDVLEFITLKMANFKKEDKKLNNIFLTISIPDEFMYRLLKQEDWYLISPEQHLDGVHLYDVCGEEYSKLYQRMVESDLIEKKKIDISKLFSSIANSMLQTGSPFLFFKDAVNYTSNHKHHGVLQGTNLCTEILEYYDDDETACCNLTSLNLKKFVKDDKTFDFDLFEKKIYNIVYILNNSIDVGKYSHDTCKKSNLNKRPLGIGIQGLADMFNKMDIPYTEGCEIYKLISEALYYYGLKASNNLAKQNKFKIYDLEKKSPLNKGYFAFDLFKEYQAKKKAKLLSIGGTQLKIISNRINIQNYNMSSKFDWEELRENIKKYGTTNSLLIAYMPTSLSSGIYNNNESFEPYTYNILKRDFSVYSIITYNKKLVTYLLDNGYYNEQNVLTSLLNVEGNFMKLDNIPIEERKNKFKYFKTIYDLGVNEYTKIITCNNHLVDQGKSTNLYIKDNVNERVLKNIIDHWLSGTKTTYYYRPEIKVDPKTLKDFNNEEPVCYACM